MPVHVFAGKGDEQPAGDDLARIDRRLGDDSVRLGGADVRQGFDYISQSQHESSLSGFLQPDSIGRDVHQDDQFLDHLVEDRGGYDRGSLVGLWFLKPDVDQEMGIIHRSPADEGGIDVIAVVPVRWWGSGRCRFSRRCGNRADSASEAFTLQGIGQHLGDGMGSLGG